MVRSEVVLLNRWIVYFSATPSIIFINRMTNAVIRYCFPLIHQLINSLGIISQNTHFYVITSISAVPHARRGLSLGQLKSILDGLKQWKKLNSDCEDWSRALQAVMPAKEMTSHWRFSKQPASPPLLKKTALMQSY